MVVDTHHVPSVVMYDITFESKSRAASTRRGKQTMGKLQTLFIGLSLLPLGCDAWSIDAVAKVNAPARGWQLERFKIQVPV